MIGYKEIIMMITALSMVAIMVYAAPSPASSKIFEGPTTFRNNTAGTAESFVAEGGNVTKYNLSQKVQSPNWATIWGEIRGQWVLEAPISTNNNTNLHIYNWTKLATNLTGYVFFTNSTIINWANLQLSNIGDANAEDKFLKLTGKDNISETYLGATTHPELTIGSQTVLADASIAVEIMGDPAHGHSHWTNVMIESDAGASGYVYTALINTTGINYAGQAADYEIIIPVDGETHTRTYYVFASLE